MRLMMEVLHFLMPNGSVVASANTLLLWAVHSIWFITALSLLGCACLTTSRGYKRKVVGSVCMLCAAMVFGVFALHVDRHLLSPADVMLPAPHSGDMRVATFNLRSMDINDGPDNGWEPNRKGRACNMLNMLGAAIIGTQEGHRQQLDYLVSCTPVAVKKTADWRWIGAFDAPPSQCSDSAIMYDAAVVSLEAEGTVWMSATPFVQGSKIADSALPRSATWALFHEKGSKRKVCFVNTHLDHVGEHARNFQAAVVKSLAAAACSASPDAVVVLTGDFNTLRHTAPWYTLLHNVSHNTELEPAVASIMEHFGQPARRDYDMGWRDAIIAAVSPLPFFSFHAFVGSTLESQYFALPISILLSLGSLVAPHAPLTWMPETLHIDWILVDQRVNVSFFGFDVRHFAGFLPSDHYPAVADLAY